MKVIYNDEEFEIDKGTKVKEIFDEEIVKEKIIACICNNQVKSLDHELNEDTKIELLDYTHPEGKQIYIRGLMYIMAKALYELYPESLLKINYQLSNAMFCKITNMEITEELLNNVSNKMKEIISKNFDITKRTISREEAVEFYKKEKNPRGIVQLESDQKNVVSLYYCDNYYDYFFGVMPIKTGVMNVFELLKYEDGFLVRYPSRKHQNVLLKYQNGPKLMNALDEYEIIHNKLEISTISQLNKEVENDNARSCILIDEALHEKKMAEIANEIAKREQVRMILIAGPSSSGKTTFAQRLGIELRINGLRPVTLSVDNYFVERENNPKDENGNYDFECIEAIDLDLLNDHLIRLLNGEEVIVPTFDFSVGHKQFLGNKLKLGKEDVLIIEGIHCLNDKLTMQVPDFQKYKIYISDLTVLNMDYHNSISTTDTRLIRRIVRDNQFRNYSALHTLKMWYSVNRGEKKNIFPHQENADVIFNSSLVYELGALKDFAIPLLKQIDSSEPEYAKARKLIQILGLFKSIPTNEVPNNSLLREFIGGSIFNV